MHIFANIEILCMARAICISMIALVYHLYTTLVRGDMQMQTTHC